MPMREECVHFQSRVYRSGETVRQCKLDLAPEAPWRCPADCPAYELQIYDSGFVKGSLARPPVPDQPQGEAIAEVLDEAENIVNAVWVEALNDHITKERRPRRRWWWPFRRR